MFQTLFLKKTIYMKCRKQGIIDQGIQQGWIRYSKCNYWDDSYTGRSGFEVQIDNDNLHSKKDWGPVWIVLLEISIKGGRVR